MAVQSQQIHWDRIFKRNTIWSSYRAFSLDLTRQDELSSSYGVCEIRELVQNLTKVANVKRVRATAPKFPNIHWIELELELQPETELSNEVWYEVQDIVIDYEWKLRDNSGEKWYFHAQPVGKLSKLRGTAKVVADSYHSQSTPLGKQTWSSPPLNLVVHSNL